MLSNVLLTSYHGRRFPVDIHIDIGYVLFYLSTHDPLSTHRQVISYFCPLTQVVRCRTHSRRLPMVNPIDRLMVIRWYADKKQPSIVIPIDTSYPLLYPFSKLIHCCCTHRWSIILKRQRFSIVRPVGMDYQSINKDYHCHSKHTFIVFTSTDTVDPLSDSCVLVIYCHTYEDRILLSFLLMMDIC